MPHVMLWDAKGEPFEVPETKVVSLLAAGFALLPPAPVLSDPVETVDHVLAPAKPILVIAPAPEQPEEPEEHAPTLINHRKSRSAKVTADE